jgi:hypothetical protein
MLHERQSDMALLFAIYSSFLIILFFIVQLSFGWLEKYEFGNQFSKIDHLLTWKCSVAIMSIVWGIFILSRPQKHGNSSTSYLGYTGAIVLSYANTMILNYSEGNLIFLLNIIGIIILGTASIRNQLSKFISFILIACNGLFLYGLYYSGILWPEPVIHVFLFIMPICSILVLLIPQHKKTT